MLFSLISINIFSFNIGYVAACNFRIVNFLKDYNQLSLKKRNFVLAFFPITGIHLGKCKLFLGELTLRINVSRQRAQGVSLSGGPTV